MGLVTRDQTQARSQRYTLGSCECPVATSHHPYGLVRTTASEVYRDLSGLLKIEDNVVLFNIMNRGDTRRKRVYPDDWKGTFASPECPGPNQPRVVPPFWDTNGLGTTALAPQLPAATNVSLMIVNGRDDRFVGQNPTLWS